MIIYGNFFPHAQITSVYFDILYIARLIEDDFLYRLFLEYCRDFTSHITYI